MYEETGQRLQNVSTDELKLMTQPPRSIISNWCKQDMAGISSGDRQGDVKCK